MLLKKSTIIAALLMALPFTAQAQTVNVAVAANFAGPLQDIATAFNEETGYSVTFTSGATGNLTNSIIAGNASGYDVLLAANTASPANLYNNYNTLVVGSPFTYTTGHVVLWSNGVVNVSGSTLPSGNIVIADPLAAPYGLAATQVLANVYNITLPNDRVSQRADIGLTYDAIAAASPTYPMGFVAKSQVCNNGQAPVTGTMREYTAGTDYTAIIQNGIVINRTRTTAENNAVTAFRTFLLDPNGTAASIISSYCYN